MPPGWNGRAPFRTPLARAGSNCRESSGTRSPPRADPASVCWATRSELAGSQDVAVAGVVEAAVGEVAILEDAADEDEGGARDLGGADGGSDGGERAADDLLVGPADANGDDGGTVGAVQRRQVGHDAADVADREMDGERRAGGAQRPQILAVRHRRGLALGAREDDRLAH